MRNYQATIAWKVDMDGEYHRFVEVQTDDIVHAAEQVDDTLGVGERIIEIGEIDEDDYSSGASQVS